MPLISTVSLAIDFNLLILSSLLIFSESSFDALLTVDCTKISGSIDSSFVEKIVKMKNH